MAATVTVIQRVVARLPPKISHPFVDIIGRGAYCFGDDTKSYSNAKRATASRRYRTPSPDDVKWTPLRYSFPRESIFVRYGYCLGL